MWRDEEYYKKRIGKILTTRQTKLKKAFNSVYEDQEAPWMKTVTIVILVLLLGSVIAFTLTLIPQSDNHIPFDHVNTPAMRIKP